MEENKNLFYKSKMNKDTDSRLIAEGDYVDATNFESGDSGVLENCLSNKKLTNLSLGNNVNTIGMYFDEFDDKIYWFCKSDSGDYIIEHSQRSLLTSIVLEDTSANVLNFGTDNLITGVNLIVDTNNNRRLLCWTDNRNAPRAINIERAKTYGANNFTEDDISLYKKPPLYEPTITYNTTVNFENFLEDRFIGFAYRYKYLDGGYSPLSPFTGYSFVPNPFDLDYDVMTNEGMTNLYNEVIISFDTGSERVTDIEVVFKESDSVNINIIETLNKTEQDWGDNLTKTLTFNNSKIYKVLPEDELYRAYDNIPRLAKSQEVIGNRLVFGNYLEGYNIEDSAGDSIQMDYTLSLITNNLAYTQLSYVESAPDADGSTIIIIDLTGVDLVEGLRINLDLAMASAPIAGEFSHNFSYVLTQDYVDTDELFADADYIYFVENIMTSTFQTEVTATSPPFTVDTTYIPFEAISTTTGFLSIKAPKLLYDIDPTPGSPGSGDETTETYGFDYESVTDISYRLITSDASLKTNRSYEIGIIYLDEYGRASTVLTSPTNTIYIGQENSVTQNKISVELNHVPPSWAKYYRFVLKENKGDYSLIYVNFYISDSLFRYVKLEGSNRDKVQAGDVVYVKSDKNGPVSELIETRVLEIESKDANFILNNYEDSAETIEKIEPEGVYMKIKPAGYTMEVLYNNKFYSSGGPIISGNAVDGGTINLGHTFTQGDPSQEPTSLGGFWDFDTLEYDDNPIPEGTRIVLFFEVKERPRGGGGARYTYNKTFTSQNNYDNFQIWWEAEVGADLGVFEPRVDYSFYRDRPGGTDTNYLRLDMTALGDFAPSMEGRIEILYSSGDIIYETSPKENANEIFYETGQTFAITGGNHIGNTQSQDVTLDPRTPAIHELNAFNCFSMGNGAESYQIKDQLNGKKLKIDLRPTTTTYEKYREKRRLADLTYSEPYEQTSNVNGLNEFNLSKANWKTLDDKYGSIQKLFSTDTNLLVFQEDKIHKVMFQKDVLFDADSSGNIRESNKVLGQEVPYTGEYGISTQPESFAQFGNSKYFTDTKRGVVLRLDESGITEISENGMSDFFREEFKTNGLGKKIGAYDVYNEKYVLYNELTSTTETPSTPAGSKVSAYEVEDPIVFELSPTESPADIDVNYDVTGTVNISINENGTDTDLGNVTGTGTIVYSRVFSPTIYTLTFTTTPISATPSFDIDIPVPVAIVPPVEAVDDNITIFNTGSDSFNVLANDTFTTVAGTTVTIITPPYKGVAVVNADKTIGYTHGGFDLLPDNIIYQIDDGATTDTGTVNITVVADTSGGATGTAFNMSTYGVPSATSEGSGVCSATIDTVKYHDGSSYYPVLGDFIYDDVNKVTKFKGLDKFYRIDGDKSIRVSNVGEVTSVWICGISV
jgi:hypothetical protein